MAGAHDQGNTRAAWRASTFSAVFAMQVHTSTCFTPPARRFPSRAQRTSTMHQSCKNTWYMCAVTSGRGFRPGQALLLRVTPATCTAAAEARSATHRSGASTHMRHLRSMAGKKAHRDGLGLQPHHVSSPVSRAGRRESRYAAHSAHIYLPRAAGGSCGVSTGICWARARQDEVAVASWHDATRSDGNESAGGRPEMGL